MEGAKTATPTYSMRINRFTNRLHVNINLPRIPDRHINLNVEPRCFQVDTLTFAPKPYYLKASYPDNAVVDETKAVTSFNGNLLVVRAPVVSRDDPAEAAPAAVQDTLTAAERLASSESMAVAEGKVATVPRKHRREVKHPDAHLATQKPGKYVSDKGVLLKIVKKAAKAEITRQSEKLAQKAKEEITVQQQYEARQKQRDLKQTKKRAIVERAKAKVAQQRGPKK